MEYSYLLLLPQQIQFSHCNAEMFERWRFSAPIEEQNPNQVKAILNCYSKAKYYAVMLCEGQQINKFLLAIKEIAIVTGDLEKSSVLFNGAVDEARIR